MPGDRMFPQVPDDEQERLAKDLRDGIAEMVRERDRVGAARNRVIEAAREWRRAKLNLSSVGAGMQVGSSESMRAMQEWEATARSALFGALDALDGEEG